ncbi:MAG: ORF6N domain-containing protein [Verrucomicrobia bacterium]|nr:ORF6N domain-containing protein [Verrucomicrobiota bacterium]
MATKKPDLVLPKIHTLRKQKVVLDSDLAVLYGVPTKRLNEAVRRNAERFPDDFRFQLTSEEVAILRSQFATLKTEVHGKHTKYRPTVFSEHGALMAATILRSPRAVQMSIYLVRAFVQMRGELQTNLTILKRLAEVDRKLIEHDSVLREVITRLQPLLDAPDEPEAPTKRKIGFHEGNR